MNDLKERGTSLVNRTPELIAAEINSIKEQTRRMVLYNSIEIGRRLIEAKALLDHGEWGKWLETSVDYSQSTANNLMRIFEEYGSEQLSLLGDNAKSQALGNLSYTQAVALLGIPEEEREKFINENDIENMSTRDLQQAIKERDQANKEKNDALKQLADTRTEAEKTAAKVNELQKEKDKLKKDYDLAGSKTKDELKKKTNEAAELRKRIKELEAQSLEVKPGATEEEIQNIKSEAAQKYETELAVLKVEKEHTEKRVKELEIKVAQQNNAAALKYQVYFDELVKKFGDLLGALAEIKEADPEAHERFKNATAGLIKKMSERIS